MGSPSAGPAALIYRLVECHVARELSRERLDCFMCGKPLDMLIGRGNGVYELVSSPQVSRLLKV